MSGKRTMLVISTLIAIAIVVWGGMAVWRLFFHETLVNKVLIRDYQITSEWNEIGTRNDLKVEKDYHYISLQIEPPLKAHTIGNPVESGIMVPGGAIVHPEITLIDVDGNEYPLVYSGHRGGGPNEFVNYKYDGNLATNKAYEKVKVRCAYPLTVKAVIWSGYDQRDIK